jgi:hypothetical protein
MTNDLLLATPVISTTDPFWYFLVIAICITTTLIFLKSRECQHKFVQVKEWTKETKEETRIYHLDNLTNLRNYFWLITTSLIQQDRCEKCGKTDYHWNKIKEDYRLL